MTVLSNMIVIDASAARVWQALSGLTGLERYDPGVKASVLVGDLAAGVGAQRRCELRPHGWFIEEVTMWQPIDRLAFELVTCSLPVAGLQHEYTLDRVRRADAGAPGDDVPAEVRPRRHGA